MLATARRPLRRQADDTVVMILDGEDSEPFRAEVDLEYFEKGFFVDEVN